jgi:tRNA U38,U39,U40 pseudouridine synthase TruA
VRILNSFLPTEIRVRAWAPIDESISHALSLSLFLNFTSFCLLSFFTVCWQTSSFSHAISSHLISLSSSFFSAFNVRRDCEERTYKYFFLRKNLNIQKMREAAGLVIPPSPPSLSLSLSSFLSSLYAHFSLHIC